MHLIVTDVILVLVQLITVQADLFDGLSEEVDEQQPRWAETSFFIHLRSIRCLKSKLNFDGAVVQFLVVARGQQDSYVVGYVVDKGLLLLSEHFVIG